MSGAAPAAALSAKGVTVRFGGLTALDGVDLDVAPGVILGIIGPNGAGKSTLFDAVCGLTPLDAGRVVLNGEDVTGRPPHERGRMGLARSFQDGRLFPSLTVTECVAIALERHLPVEAPVSIMVGGPLARARRREVLARAGEVVDSMGLGPYADAFVRELSTGTRRLVDLACVVAHDPAVLLLDEPSSGIAQAETEHLGPLIRRVHERSGCTILLIEHDIPLVTSVSDELLALETGRVLTRGTPDEVVNDERVISAYLGTERAIAAELTKAT